MKIPATRYAQSGGLSIAYQVIGDAPRTIVWIPGFVSNLEIMWNEPAFVGFLEVLQRLGRVICFDKRGTGLSDPFSGAPTLEQRIDDVQAVMNDAGVERAVLFGISEGGPMAALFAATHPDRVSHLILYGSMPCGSLVGADLPESTWSGWRSVQELVDNEWGSGRTLRYFGPSVADRPLEQRGWAQLERLGASPAMASEIIHLADHIDVRPVLGSIDVPTLVLHQEGDTAIDVALGHLLAKLIPGATLGITAGRDHVPFRDADRAALGDHLVRFLEGTSEALTQRRLGTVLFTDIVDSTAQAADAGDEAWAHTMAAHDAAMRSLLDEFDGREIKTLGDGFLSLFETPGRALACALSLAQQAKALGIEIRAGVHVGDIDVSLDDIRGLTVNIAARVCSEAGPGEVLSTGTVRDLSAGSSFSFESVGVRDLKGVPGDWELMQVARRNDGPPALLPSSTPPQRLSDRAFEFATKFPAVSRRIVAASRRLDRVLSDRRAH